MDGLGEIVALVAIAMIGTAFARKLGLLAPIVLVVAGLGLSFLPFVPEVHLEPELVLVGILPPLLYVAAIEMSVPAFRFNLRPILLLAVGLVVFTAFVVGTVLHLLLPDVPYPLCVAFGAVVAPPDAVAATAVARRIGLPRRLVTILEGESLINDATALVTLRVSVAAATGAAVGFLDVAADVALAAGGGIAIGGAGALVLAFLHKRIKDPLIDTALSLLTPFLIVLPAEAVHSSGVVAVVVAGLYIGHRMPTLMSAASRLQTDGFWRMVRFLLEGMVFLLVGLQLREILRDLDTPLSEVVWVTAVVVLTLILARFVWVFPATYAARLVPRARHRDPATSASYPAVIGWAGMRGVVTLAAALALPETSEVAYPRELFVWLAFAVIVVTLVLQGATLPWYARRLRVPPDDPTQDTLAEAAIQNAASRAARDRLEALADGAPAITVERLRELAEHRNNKAWERLGGGAETPSRAYGRLRREMIDAEREVFRSARDEGRIPEEVLRRAQRDLDLEESLLQRTEE
ncbi:Na+/H+ antiporter [Phytohabitans sp. ZYX-F-186]|uniref:Na+/H+ antiporter n=1 Tax=Phytohabitans maris TaxID=3071409 RepID=A0ABU0ZSE7_9ACTN|nr:Na+/H+ antiporter [Phytohabitans sp. ZYX-F-186]MDQ7909249.1 Na+/H+ antiporter [Phytohabitans sp. ZYX-F-186]